MRARAHARRERSEQILRDADRLEYRLDEAVGHAGEVAEQRMARPPDEGAAPARSPARPRTVIPSLLRFRRTAQEASEEEEEEPERAASFDEFVRHSNSMLKSSSDDGCDAGRGGGDAEGLAEQALRALEMQVADAAGFRASVEAVTGKERAGPLFS
jgi:hypothetical protein